MKDATRAALEHALVDTAGEVQTEVDKFGMDQLLESDLRSAFRRALYERVPGSILIERRFELPHWTGSVGGVDLVVENDGLVTHAFEFKFTRASLADVLWDFLKLASISSMQLRRFVVVAAPSPLWERRGTTAQLLCDGSWKTVDVLTDIASLDWKAWLRRYSTRPRRLKGRLESRLVGEAVLHTKEGSWPMRVVEIAPVGDTEVALDEDGRPIVAPLER